MFHDFFEYHQKTKHSYFSVRSHPNRIDWDNPPSRFKPYPIYIKKTPLDLSNPLHHFIYLAGGITAKKSYPGMEYYLRVNPSAGALYPNELYFQSRNEEGLEDGIYHYDVASNSIELLYELEDDGIETALGFETKQDGLIFLISSVYYRSSWKYKNRAFRYCLLDAGHLLGTLEASSYLFAKPYEVLYGFDKEQLNQAFGFDQGEFFTTALMVRSNTQEKVTSLKMALPYVNPTGDFVENTLIEKAYLDSIELRECKSVHEQPNFYYNKEVFEEIIKQRRSIREFTKQSITKREFESIYATLKQSIPSDCDESIDIYCVINRVQGMPLGLYKDGEYIKEHDYQKKAGYLCLEQDLGFSSAVTFFLTSTSKNYQPMYQKAGLIGHRLYLIANYLGYGCSGIGAYYDDEVNTFLEKNCMVLYALAIGN